AAAQYDAVLADWQRRAGAATADSQVSRGVMMAHARLCTLRRQLDDVRGAQDSCRKAVAMLESSVARQPDDAALAKLQASAYVGLGNALQAGGDTSGAREWLTRGTQQLRVLARRFPSDAEVSQRLAASTLYFGQFLEANGDLAAAANTYAQAIDVMA